MVSITSRRRSWRPFALAIAVVALVVLPLLATVGVAAAITDTWTGAGSTANWSDAGNWDQGVPVNGDDLVFPVRNSAGTIPASIDDIPSLSLSQLEERGSYQFSATNGATLSMNGEVWFGDTSQAGPRSPFAIPIQSSLSPQVFRLLGYGPFPVASTISDPGGAVQILNESGGTLDFVSGGGLNTPAVELDGGALGVEGGGSLGSSTVTFTGSYTTSLLVGIYGSPANLSTPLILDSTNGATIDVGAGSTVSGPINQQNWNLGLALSQGSVVSSPISGAQPVYVSGNPGITANLTGTSDFSGGLHVYGSGSPDFVLRAAGPQSLGTGPVSVTGAELSLQASGSPWTNALNLNAGVLSQGGGGADTWSGPITATGYSAALNAAAPNSTLTVTGAIQGPYLLQDFTGDGTLVVASSSAEPSLGVNTFQEILGPVHLVVRNPANTPLLTAQDVQVLYGATLEMASGSDNEFSSYTDIEVSGTVNINDTTQSVNSVRYIENGGVVSGSGTLVANAVTDLAATGGDDALSVGQLQLSGSQPTLDPGGRTLMVTSPVNTTNGVLIANSSIGGGASGSVVLTYDNTYGGTTTVSNGLYINGSQPQSPVVVTRSGYLSGHGSTGDVTSQGGFVAPDGSLRMKSLTLDSQSRFGTSVSGSHSAAHYGQAISSGPVDLGGSALSLTLNYQGLLGDSFYLIRNESGLPVSGTFASLPEGAHFVDGPYTLGITYQGGSGHDVVVTIINPALITQDAYGGLHVVGGAPIDTAGAPYWYGWRIARGVALRAGYDGGYELDGWGGLHAFGNAPPVTPSAYWPGRDIARGLVLRPDGRSGYVLDAYGGIHPFGGAPPAAPSSYWPGWDIARGITYNPCDPTGNSGYVLDGWGGVHPFGGAPDVTVSAHWYDWDIARAVTADYACDRGVVVGFVLDGWGGLHPFVQQGWELSSTPSTGAYWPHNDIARAIVTTAPEQGYVIDGWGGIHPFGGAPTIGGGGYWPGWDVVSYASTA